MPLKIIGIAGHIRSGKSTATRYLSKTYGYKPASNSELLANILKSMEIPTTRENLGNLGNALFETLGNDIFALFRLNSPHDGVIIIDGIRYIEELTCYSKSGAFRLLGITAPNETRFYRAIREKDSLKDAGVTREAFEKYSNSRSELDVPNLLAQADKVIHNNSSLNEFERMLDKTISEWTENN